MNDGAGTAFLDLAGRLRNVAVGADAIVAELIAGHGHVVDVAQATNIANELTRIADIARDGNLATDRDLARGISRDFDRVHRQVRYFADCVAGSLAMAWAIRDRHLDSINQATYRLRCDLKSCSSLVGRLLAGFDVSTEFIGDTRAGMGRAASRLVAIAVAVLPRAHQGRYAEEFRSELFELASAATPRWRQIGYAMRLLDRAWVLRAELRTPR
jgi:hypothetical protein